LWVIEQGLIGVAVAFCLLACGRFLPFWAIPMMVAVSAGAAFKAVPKLRTGIAAYAIAAALIYLFYQPVTYLWIAVLAALVLAVLLSLRFHPHEFIWRSWDSWQRWLRVVVLGLVAWAVAFAAIVSVYLAACLLLPWLAPVMLHLYNISPPLVVAIIVAVIAYSSLRQPIGKMSWYWLITPALGVAFCGVYWPSHSHLTAAIMILTAVALTAVAFVDRQRAGKTKRSLLLVKTSTTVGTAFALFFVFANTNAWFYRFAFANTLTVTSIEQAPVTVNNQLVWVGAARDYCAGENHSGFTDLGNPTIIFMDDPKSGQRKAYWQCLSHPTNLPVFGLLFNPLKATGGISQVVMADAGERGRGGFPQPVDFIFGDKSVFTRSAFTARHPGSEMQPAVAARADNGIWYLLIPYTTRVMQWGAMVPDLTGVMVVSQDGFIRDYLPEQARAAFPGVPFVPDELAREYVIAYAQDSNLLAKYGATHSLLEVSEFPGVAKGTIDYPVWQDCGPVDGIKGVFPMEPKGGEQNANTHIVYFDPVALRIEVQDVTNQGLIGPRFVAVNTAAAKFGVYRDARLARALLSVGSDHKVNWLISLVQPPAQQQTYHGYAGNVVATGNGQNIEFVTSEAEVDVVLNRWAARD
jgi:hypothetical protein